ncbi:MAG: hypothetical protein KAI53_01465 [Candidatus Aenigmarchaeota archaeon]|nr:hypothetical protein [Candidatus Aenigmarchaeota archaeon]
MKKVDYNIEFAHVYSDDKFSLEQKTSSEILRKTIENLKKDNKTFVSAILIDDYQPSYSYLDVYDFLESVKNSGFSPSYIAYESQLHSLATKLISLINKKNILEKKTETKIKSNRDTILLDTDSHSTISLKDEYFAKSKDYIETSVLIAAWYLVRLGIFTKPGLIKETKYTKKIPFVGENIMSIIPKKYRQVDEDAKAIISCTPYKIALKKIHNIYF